jgi:hypothetical protein
MDKIHESFAKYFESFGIQLPDPVPDRGQIRQGGWSIQYVILPDEEGRTCLEFLANNRFTNSRHERILSSGQMLSLPSFEDGLSYDPDVPGDHEAAEARLLAHNQAVMEDLRKKGLML